MQPPVCPRCHQVTPLPLPASCPFCGERLLQLLPPAPPAGPSPNQWLGAPLPSRVPPPLAGPPHHAPRPSDSGTASAESAGRSSPRGPRLTRYLPDGQSIHFPLGSKTTLGRHPENTVRLQDREVSKGHACIDRQGSTFLLRDLESSNGTFVNGRRIQELKLKDGDEIVVGNSRLVFHLGESQPPPSGRVTVVGSAQSMPAFLAQIDQIEDKEFRPGDQITDLAALRQDYEKLRIAHEFHRQVGLERNQKSLLEKTLQIAFQLLPADNGVLFLVDEATGELVPNAIQHRDESSSEVVLSETVLKRVMQTRQAVLTADAILDARFSSSDSIVAQGIRSAMAVPLLTKGSLKGILFLDTRERTHAFSEKDLKILSGIASQAAVALDNAEMARRIEAEAVTRAELSRFLSPAVADLVVKGQVELLRAGRLVDVTVLFADIRGFTTLAENAAPQETVSMLNAFFNAMAKAIFRYEGNLDKFIGDCVMAVWGPPSSHPDDTARALQAALEMQAAMEELNQQRIASGSAPIAIGIGVNTGPAVMGYMGSTDRHEYTAIGDSVNTAARLCGLAKGGEILATEFAIANAGGGFACEEMPISNVRGKEKGFRIYRVTGLDRTERGL